MAKDSKKTLVLVTQTVDMHDPLLGFFHAWLSVFASHVDTLYVICLNKGEYDLPDNVIVKSLGKERGVSKVRYIFSFYSFIFDAWLTYGAKRLFVHMNEIYLALLSPFWFVRKVLGVRLSWWKTHGSLSVLSKMVLPTVDMVFTATSRSFPLSTKKKVVMGHGIDTVLFSPTHPPCSQNVLSCVTFGRISPVKQYEDVLQLALTYKSAGINNIHFTIVGSPTTHEENVYYETLQAFYHTHALQSFVTFRPAVKHDEIVPMLDAADVFIHSSQTQSLDKVILEAMAMQVYPITANSACQELVQDVPYTTYTLGDIDELFSQVEHIRHLSEAACTKHLTRMRTFVIQHHNLDALITRLVRHIF